MQVTKAQKAAISYVHKMAKGWPVGIPIHKSTAKALVRKKLAVWAAPAWNYPKPVFSVRLTMAGIVYLNNLN